VRLSAKSSPIRGIKAFVGYDLRGKAGLIGRIDDRGLRHSFSLKSILRADRICKYNHFLCIEEELGCGAVYLGLESLNYND
jgi:hypothetical protein